MISREELLTQLRAMPSSLNDAMRTMELAANFIGSVSQCAPNIVEVASVIHNARYGPDYPEHLRVSFDTECVSGRAYCIKLARAVMDGFRLSHVDGPAVTPADGGGK